MKKLFYYFGIGRGEKIFAINDVIAIDKYGLTNLTEYELKEIFKRNNLKLNQYIEEVREDRGILFGFSEKLKGIADFLSFGKLLIPNIQGEYYNIYFLGHKKLILFKINRTYYSVKEAKKGIYKVLEPLDLFSRREFINLTKDWKEQWSDNENCSCETKQFKLCLGMFHSSFACIKPKDYVKLKGKIKEIYEKSQRIV